MNKKERLTLLNSMDVKDYEADGTTLYYLLVENTDENKQKLSKLGVTKEEIDGAIIDEDNVIDIKDFGFRHGGAEWYNPDLGGWLAFIPKD